MTAKKGFAAFIRNQDPASPPPKAHTPRTARRRREDAPVDPLQDDMPPAGREDVQPERVRTMTSTGRVRTHTAGRDLPAVSYRMSEERWERLKMMSIQERRPIQEMLGEAMEQYMRGRGLPW